MKINQEQRDALAPYASTYAGMMEMVRQEEDDRLLLLKEACEAATQTNCWFSTYRAAQIIKGEIEVQLSLREQFHKTATAIST